MDNAIGFPDTKLLDMEASITIEKVGPDFFVNYAKN